MNVRFDLSASVRVTGCLCSSVHSAAASLWLNVPLRHVRSDGRHGLVAAGQPFSWGLCLSLVRRLLADQMRGSSS